MKTERGGAPALVLFDLDGTLADTFPDLLWALDRALDEHGRSRDEQQDLRPQVSAGARAMLCSALGDAVDSVDVEAVRERFLELYRTHIAERTTLFDGMDQVLDELEQQSTAWGIVTNKLAYLTEPLVDALGLRTRLSALVSGDTAPRAKPHPDPLLFAAKQVGVNPARCVYVGDALKDVQAARAAHMGIVIAAYGYLGHTDRPEEWQADALLDHPAQLLEWLARQE